MSSDFLRELEKQLDLPHGVKADVIRELQSHYDELQSELVSSGLEAATAATETEHRLGSPADIAARLTAVHNTASWRSALLTAAPFVVFSFAGLLAQNASRINLPWALAAFGLTMVAGSIREIARGRRPIWMTTWLASALLIAQQVIGMLMPAHAPSDFPNAHGPAIIAGIGLCLLTFAASWATKRWQRMTIVLSITYCLAAGYFLRFGADDGITFLTVALAAILRSALLIVFARSLFEAHPYGDSMQASLFLLAVVVLWTPLDSPLILLVLPLCAISVAMLTRASQRGDKIWRFKIAFVIWALFCSSSVSDWQQAPDLGWMWIPFLMGQLSKAFFYYCFSWVRVFIPIWLDDQRRAKPDLPPEVAA